MATNCSMEEFSGGESSGPRKVVPQVIVVSDVRLYREGLAASLKASERLGVAATLAGSDLTLACLSQLRPDVVLLDMALPGCLDLPTVLSPTPPVKFVAFAVSDHDDDILACAEAGISGYVGKDDSAEDLAVTIEGVLRGELLCPPKLAARLFQRLATLAKSPEHRPAPGALTGRELEIIGLVDQGHSNKEIAQRLRIGTATVKNHVHNILQKLDVHRRGEAAAAVRCISGQMYRGDRPAP